MQLISTHVAADFDCLSALAAARRLYPDPVLAFPGSVEGAVQRYLERPLVSLPIAPLRSVARARIDRFVLVDVSELARAGPVGEWIRSCPEIPLDYYDHHAEAAPPAPGASGLVREVGATTTILVGLLRERRIRIDAPEATLLALGIHEDTGFLQFATTTAEDREAAAWLGEQGADPKIVSEYLRIELNLEQRSLLEDLRRCARRLRAQDGEAVVSVTRAPGYVRDAASSVHRLIDEEGWSTFVALIGMGERVILIGRSRGGRVDMGALARRFGGGGHAAAASAALRAMSLPQAEAALLEALSATPPALSPRPDSSSRAPRRPRSSRLPGDGAAGGSSGNPDGEEDVGEALRRALGEHRLSLLRAVGREARSVGESAFLVGGVVRDLLLGRASADLDVTVEGNAPALAQRLRKRHGGSVRAHPRFGTATWMLPDGSKLDLASTRRESYEPPGSLPRVEAGGLSDDLRRRDFTINTLAVRLDPAAFGRLVDPCGGRSDLRAGVVRALHPRSFEEDPTRALRAVRLASRLRFGIDASTRKWIREAGRSGALGRLSGERLWKELRLLLSEERVLAALAALERLGLLAPLSGGSLRFAGPVRSRLGRIIKVTGEVIGRARLGYDEGSPNRARLLLLGLVGGLAASRRRTLARRLALPALERRLLETAPTQARRVARRMGRRRPPPDSDIEAACRKLPAETLLYAAAERGGVAARRLILRYWSVLRKIRRTVTGHDLRRLGLPPGPAHARILDAVQRARLDGKARSREEELALAQRLIRLRPGGRVKA
jgi:tRNA nucleotidyltransferase/poly(A) polymerase/nanoRNase/pAp phosphatase (c-di-AMP/oligoRNAs hydrolase)